jgi:hypothetical protein
VKPSLGWFVTAAARLYDVSERLIDETHGHTPSPPLRLDFLRFCGHLGLVLVACSWLGEVGRLELHGREHAERRVPARGVVEDLDVLEDPVRRALRVGQDWRRISSFLSVAKKLSATPLSQQSPGLPIERAIPAFAQAWAKPSETS